MSTPQGLLENGLPNISRYITTNDTSGKAIFAQEIAPTSVWQTIGNKVATFFLGYTTRTFPVSLSSSSDITSYAKDLSSPPGLTVSSGTVLRFVDLAPHSEGPMHKTVSVDYGVVIEGVAEVLLDSGESKLMYRGDVCVQRATFHAWRNPSDAWSRLMFVLVAADKNEGLTEDLGSGIDDIKSSE